MSIIRIDVRKLLLSDVADRVKKYKGLMGEALESSLAFEISDWQNFGFHALGKGELVKVNIQAYKWANDVASSLH